MKTSANQLNRAFSMVDLMVIVAALLGMLFIIFPMLTRHDHRAPRISCTNNLKQVGLAFRLWSGDNNDQYPMSVSVTNGGVMELAQTGNVASVFLILSNELNTPKVLFCPVDQKRIQALTFDQTAPPGAGPFTNNINTSYFVGLDATETAPNMFLSGDDNFLIGGNPNQPIGGAPVQPGVLMLKTNDAIAWSNTRHEKVGNIGLSDGSVQGFTTAALRAALTNTGVAINQLAMP